MSKQVVQNTENLCAVLYILVTAFEGIQFYNIMYNNYLAPSEASKASLVCKQQRNKAIKSWQFCLCSSSCHSVVLDLSRITSQTKPISS